MFKFNLQPLLNHRRYLEEVLQKELAQFRKRLTAEQNKLRRLKEKKREYSQKLQQRQKENGTVSDLILYLQYLDRLSTELEHQHQQVVAAEKDFKNKRNDLIKTMKNRKILEQLKENRSKAYQQQMLKNERKFMDEVAAKQFSNKS
ncbi:MAG: flagellar export protein FliJ [Desulfobacteraceae bacterium]|jgi:flagellar FliJ protein